MIIDIRTQLEPTADPWADACAASAESHTASMSCVDTAVVVGWRAERLGVHTPIETIASFVHADPARRVGIAGIDPMTETALQEIDKARDLGLVGVAISPADQGYRPTHDQALAIFEKCADLGMPALVANPSLTDRRSMMEFAQPALLDEVARELPRLTLVLGDLGFGWVDEALLLTAKHERVFAEISGLTPHTWSLYATLQAALERRVMNKLLFGSGFPRQKPEQAIARLYSINTLRNGSSFPTIPRESLRSIVERDAMSALGVDHLPARRPAESQPRSTKTTALPSIEPTAGGRTRA